MTLPASGNISMSQVAAELGIGLPLSLTDSRVRALAGVPSGSISMSNLYGKSAYTPMTVTTSGGSGSAPSETSGGTVSASASMTVSGGSGGYSITWTVTSNPGGASMSALSGTSVSASHTFAKLANGELTVTLSMTVTDNTGHSVTQSGIEIYLAWGNLS